MLAFPPPPSSSRMEEVAHHPSRFRAGSISSRLRSASDVFDEGLLQNRQQKGVLKDMIISGDERLAEALEKYDRGDKDPIKTMLKEGILNRKSSLDLLGEAGDLSLDFLSVSGNHGKGNWDTPFPMDEDELSFEILLQDTEVVGKSPAARRQLNAQHPRTLSISRAQMGARSASLSSVSSSKPLPIPQNKSLGNSLMAGSEGGFGSLGVSTFSSLGTPPPDLMELQLFDEAGLGAWSHPALRGGSLSKREAMDYDSDDLESPPSSPPQKSGVPPLAPKEKNTNAGGSTHPKSRRAPKANSAAMDEVEGGATSAPMAIPRAKANAAGGRQTSNTSNKRTAPPLSASQASQASTLPNEELAASRRALGVPMVGAYSPDSRRLRVEKFVMKRDRRVWKKKVKYDVRKNFADSRLRVKGRFVKKEDEEMLRDLMAMI